MQTVKIGKKKHFSVTVSLDGKYCATYCGSFKVPHQVIDEDWNEWENPSDDICKNCLKSFLHFEREVTKGRLHSCKFRHPLSGWK